MTGGTRVHATDPDTYCAMANAGYDFIWTEMQHDARDWQASAHVARLPVCQGGAGVRVAYTDEREDQHAHGCGRAGPGGARRCGPRKAMRAATGPFSRRWESAARRRPGVRPECRRCAGRLSRHHQRQSGADPDDRDPGWAEGCRRDRQDPGVTAIFAASGDLGNFSGYKQGNPDYEREINIVHDAAIKAGVRLCGPIRLARSSGLHLLPGRQRKAAIARGVAAELGPLANTQGKPEVGPFAGPPKP